MALKSEKSACGNTWRGLRRSELFARNASVKLSRAKQLGTCLQALEKG